MLRGNYRRRAGKSRAFGGCLVGCWRTFRRAHIFCGGIVVGGNLYPFTFHSFVLRPSWRYLYIGMPSLTVFFPSLRHLHSSRGHLSLSVETASFVGGSLCYLGIFSFALGVPSLLFRVNSFVTGKSSGRPLVCCVPFSFYLVFPSFYLVFPSFIIIPPSLEGFVGSISPLRRALLQIYRFYKNKTQEISTFLERILRNSILAEICALPEPSGPPLATPSPPPVDAASRTARKTTGAHFSNHPFVSVLRFYKINLVIPSSCANFARRKASANEAITNKIIITYHSKR